MWVWVGWAEGAELLCPRPPSPVPAADPPQAMEVGRRLVLLALSIPVGDFPSCSPFLPLGQDTELGGPEGGKGKQRVFPAVGGQGLTPEQGANPQDNPQWFRVALPDQGPLASCVVRLHPQQLPGSPWVPTYPRSQQLMPSLWVPSTA